MKEPIQESTDLRMIAALFPRCDDPATVTEHIQTCLHDVATRAAERLEALEEDLRSTEQYTEYLHQILGVTGTPKAEIMKMDPEYLRRRWADAEEALRAIQNRSVSEDTETGAELAVQPNPNCASFAEYLLEATAEVKTAFDNLCVTIFNHIGKEVL